MQLPRYQQLIRTILLQKTRDAFCYSISLTLFLKIGHSFTFFIHFSPSGIDNRV
nr:MAG TPA: hypothetical protein [Bacteriophage sp.]